MKAAKTLKNASIKNRSSWEQILQNFIFHKKAQRKSERTIKDYQYHIITFFAKYPNCLKDDTLQECVYGYFAQEVKPNTHNLRRQYLRSFFGWAIINGYIKDNPVDTIPKLKGEERICTIPDSIIDELLKLPNMDMFAGLRDMILIRIQLETGMRPNEALQL